MPANARVLVLGLVLAASLPAHSRGRSQVVARADSPAGPREFVRISPGRFLMGSPPDEPGHFEDERQHRVTLTRAFDLCTHHVTQAEWQTIMSWNECRFEGHADHPVENVSWFDCIDYCNRRSVAEHRSPVYTITDRHYERHHLVSAEVTWDRSADGYRLPTESEWEYACRAGTTTAFYNGPITTSEPARCSPDSGLARIGWYCMNSRRQTHPVMAKPPNAWGLYDMAGNVQQWTWDGFEEWTGDSLTDPARPATGGLRVWRGGGWDYDPRHCRSADRGRDGPEGWFHDVGLRVARSVTKNR